MKLKLLSCLLAVCSMFVAASEKLTNSVLALPLSNVVNLPNQTLKNTPDSVELTLPALPEKPGSVVVLRFRMVSYSDNPGGCNFNARIKCNGQPITRYTTDGLERMIGRSSTFALTNDTVEREFPVFTSGNIMTMFAPNVDSGDKSATDNLGATFLLMLNDLVRGVDGNTVEFINVRAKGYYRDDLIVTDIQVGYLDKKSLPKSKSFIPSRKPIAEKVKKDDFVLELGAGGGFAVQVAGLPRLQVETGFGMTYLAKNILLAGDDTSTQQFTVKKTDKGAVLSAQFENGVTLQRYLEYKNGQLSWREKWSNASKEPQGIPFRHRLFFANNPAKFFLGGDGDTGSLASTVGNPTLFLQDKANGKGYGIVAENDEARLLMGLRGATDVAELYSTHFALAPGKSLELEYSIIPERTSEGYFGFINRVRQRWLGNKTATAPGAFFWNTDYRRLPGKDDAEKIRNGYAHLGPIVVAYKMWARLGFDVEAFRHGGIKYKEKYVPVAPDALLAYAHREYYFKEFARVQKLFKENAPNAKLIMIAHPAMEIVYTPLADKLPFAADAIRTAQGGVFNDPYYSHSYLGEAVKHGWAIYYYVPKTNGPYEQYLVNDLKRNILDIDAPGIYFDEFSFCGPKRDYSRYDYSSSDGFSADLDANGKFIRYKSDNCLASVHARQTLVYMASSHNKLFYCNGACALSGAQKLPVIAFTEGGNGVGRLGDTHLSQVPTALGNFGDTTTMKGIFDNVKLALKMGSVYSPDGNLLAYKSQDNFVCKMFPLTVQGIHSGYVIGKERVITMKSGVFDWPGATGRAKLFCYNANGELLSSQITEVNNSKIKIAVPENGLVIAELII